MTFLKLLVELRRFVLKEGSMNVGLGVLEMELPTDQRRSVEVVKEDMKTVGVTGQERGRQMIGCGSSGKEHLREEEKDQWFSN